MKKFIFFLKVLINSKWIFKYPVKKDILVYDGIKNPFKNYFTTKQMNIFYNRGEEINILILIQCVMLIKLKPSDYLEKYLQYSKPKLILTAANNYGFYKLSKKHNIKTAFVQMGQKTFCENDLRSKEVFNKKNKKVFFVDYMFVFNPSTAKLFNSFVGGKKIVIGSFKNNESINFNNQKKNKIKEVLFISCFKPPEYNNFDEKLGKKFTYHDLYKNDKKLLIWLGKICNKYSLKLNILGRNANSTPDLNQKTIAAKLEKKYYDLLIGKNRYSFIQNYHGAKANYSEVYKYEYVFTIDSTLGTENFINLGKTGFIFNRPFVYPIKTRRFGGMEGFHRSGPNWTTYNNYNEFLRVFKYTISASDKKFFNLRNKYYKNIMNFDKNNKIFISKMKEILD
jgi:surface carbohydrate biosynthesis protein